MGVWFLVCAPTRICKPNYWTQLVNATERLLTRQTNPDFMICCQKSVRKIIMPDCKNPRSISNQILLWTLLGYVHLYSRLLFFCTIVFFLFVATMIQYTELKTDSLRRFPYAKASSLLSCCPYRVLC